MLESWGPREKIFALKHPIDVRLIMNTIHIKGKIEFKCPAQINAWLKSCLELMLVEKIKVTPTKEKQQIWNRSPPQSHHVLVSLIMIIPASDPRLYI